MTAGTQTGGMVGPIADDRPPRPQPDHRQEVHTVTSELRQLRRVRWGVRLTLALGISASLAANILHAHHVLIDQVISGWPPVAVFATIEAIARVPIRRRWLAAIRMTGLGFVAAIAFWVSYWHMASVAAEHGENGSKYLLPLSVDGLVVVASISLVELTGQISAVEAATRAVAAPAPATPQPVTVAAAAPPLAGPGMAAPPYDPPGAALPQPIAVGEAWPRLDRPSVVLPQPDRQPQRGTAAAALTPAASVLPAGDAVETEAADTRAATVQPVALVGAPGSHDSDAEAAAPAADVPADATRDALADEAPPENPNEAILWWRRRDPTLTFNQIAARVGRSDRTVRRVLDAAPPAALSQRLTPEDAVAPSGLTTRRADPRDLAGGRPANGAPVEDLAESVTSS